MNKFYFKDLSIFLQKNSVKFRSKIDKNTLFDSMSTLRTANKNDLTFFHNTKYLQDLKNTKAKACFIENKNIIYLNKKCFPIIVDDPYLAYALTTNFILPNQISNGIINSTSIIDKESILEKNTQLNYTCIF